MSGTSENDGLAEELVKWKKLSRKHEARTKLLTDQLDMARRRIRLLDAARTRFEAVASERVRAEITAELRTEFALRLAHAELRAAGVPGWAAEDIDLTRLVDAGKVLMAKVSEVAARFAQLEPEGEAGAGAEGNLPASAELLESGASESLPPRADRAGSLIQRGVLDRSV